MLKSLTLATALVLSPLVSAQAPDWYPPQSSSNATITTPAEFLGYPLGEWHLRHDQINFYLKQLAAQSPRVSLEDTGLSHEARQQLTAVITSPTNQQKLPQILAQRAKVKQGQAENSPLVIWLAYSIHGDEASGAHAATALAYYLSASEEAWVKELLEKAVVLVTPTQNPDGLDRFSTWANNNRGKVPVGDNHSREHTQDWPRGRFNHYLADLNRDWLFLAHPESQGRVALFHKWQPHYLGDFHEMGHEQSYFFQPGVPDRTHPLTPATNQALTDKLADFHRDALDAKDQAYFSRQAFDDFFYGKGSTYPDINGAIGVLFEQASARGQLQDSANGPVVLSEAIANQFATSLSSLRGAIALEDELKQYQTEFFKGKASDDSRRLSGTLLRAPKDPARRDALASLLAQHKVEHFFLSRDIEADDLVFGAEDSLFIPANQPQQALVEAMFDKRTEFKDATFYDVSSFALQSAYDLLKADKVKVSRNQLTADTAQSPDQALPDNAVAYLVDWRHSNAAPMLQQLLNADIQVKVATTDFSVRGIEAINWPEGSLYIPAKQAHVSKQQLRELLSRQSQEWGVKVVPASTFAGAGGIDLGSDDFRVIKPVKPLLIAGRGTSTTETGQLWNFMDSRLGIATPLIDASRLSRVDLGNYSHLIFASGSFSTLDAELARDIASFVERGGTVIAQKSALNWLSKNRLMSAELISSKEFAQAFDTKGLTFADRDSLNARKAIGGAIVELTLDAGHPLNYGMTDDKLPVMKNRAIGFKSVDKPFVVAAEYSEQVLKSGYMAPEYQQKLASTPAILVETKGKGEIVALADNLMFRNTWLGTERVYANALYFVPVSMR
ncbi:peptidase M14 [Shewanella corallii]|uniref:Peptidase M14 n=1 Tax=Shewanella corallii TaxID=560080 RepID=A0ABT0NAK0_9GAMM|nr:M14 family zinc carboxypeptidase [Shewanella corallii]MCL2915170.1 peptidase M14 [Shewanella corallii]